jgi:hypothetical protein
MSKPAVLTWATSWDSRVRFRANKDVIRCWRVVNRNRGRRFFHEGLLQPSKPRMT